MSFPVPRLWIRTDADLVTAVPYLIGFPPGERSLVVLAFADNRAVFAARADLPGSDTDGDVLLDLGSELAAVTQGAHPNAEVVLVGYGPVDDVDPALRAAADVLTAKGLSVRELLRVTDSRVFNLGCDCPSCSAEGTPFDPMLSPVTAEATFTGVVDLPNRPAKEALLAPTVTASGEAMRRAVTRAAARLQLLIHDDAAVDQAAVTAITDAVSRHATGAALGDDEVSWLFVLLARPSVSDLAIDYAEPDQLHLAFWVEITRRAPESFVPAPATLLAVTAWQFGDGTLAALAAERALHVDPSCGLAEVILEAVRAGISPADVERMSGDTAWAAFVEDRD